MAIAPDDLAWNVSIGYKIALPVEEAQVQSRLLYHGRLGGDMDVLDDGPMFFYADAGLSSEFVEHKFINGDDTYEIASAAEGNDAFYDAFLAHAPIVFPVLVSIDNPVVLDMTVLAELAADLGIAPNERDKFVAEFEDSNVEHRNLVFAWAKRQGYDGAVIVNDMTPEVAGGDWCFRTSYVAFNPQRQVRFACEVKTTDKTPQGASRSLGM